MREKESGGDMPFVLSATGYNGKVYHTGIRRVFGGRYILGKTAKPQAEVILTLHITTLIHLTAIRHHLQADRLLSQGMCTTDESI